MQVDVVFINYEGEESSLTAERYVGEIIPDHEKILDKFHQRKFHVYKWQSSHSTRGQVLSPRS